VKLAKLIPNDYCFNARHGRKMIHGARLSIPTRQDATVLFIVTLEVSKQIDLELP
jgi:hypothetical protein